MLTYMRRHSKSWITKFIFGLIIIVFVFWGGSTYWAREANKVAKVDNYIISSQQFSKAYQDALSAYRERYGDMFNDEVLKSLNLKQRVLDEMIDQYIMENEAANLGVIVTDQELQDAIQQYPAFVRDGSFDLESYRRVLDYYNLTPQGFEDQQRNTILREKLYKLLTDSVYVSQQELQAAYRDKYDSYDLYFIRVNPDEQEQDIQVDENELQAYYEAHKEAYKEPPKTSIAYITFETKAYMNDITVTPEEAQEYYDNHKSVYTIPARLKVRHILTLVDPKADEKEIARKELDTNKILEEAQSGKDFAELAKKYSQDPGSAAKGGDLGTLSSEDLNGLTDGMGNILLGMQPGEIKGPVRSRFGFHIFKLDDKTDAKLKPFEDVSSAVIETLKQRIAKDRAYDEANAAFIEVYELPDVDLNAFAEARGFKVLEIGPFAENEPVKLPKGRTITQEAFKYPQGEIGDVVDIDNGYLLFQVTDRISATIPELAKVKEALISDLKQNKLNEAALGKASELASLDSSQLQPYKPESTGEFQRSVWALPKLGNAEQVKKDLDNLTSPKVYTIKKDIYVIWLKEKKNAPLEDLSQELADSLKKELLTQKKEILFETFRNQVHEKHKIIIDQEKLM
ncbi:MAG: SurA N-terminal domain-containing protein [Deltaproteobacteria bacterium]|nr:SurA N-terminal domain-containing protein [Deltaproteobacteria bacterium]